MISVCSTIYREPEALEVFVRSLLGNASDPNQVEIVIINDENNPEIRECLDRLSVEFKQLHFITRYKEERIEFFKERISFYEENCIFDSEVIKSMRKQIDKYGNGKINSIWYPAGYNFNTAVTASSGDVLMITPSDYLCTFDIVKMYQIISKEDNFAARFDWYDFTSLDPHPKMAQELRESKDIPALTEKWLNQAQREGLMWLPQQHGARIVQRHIYNQAGGFDGRWFVRAVSEDLFNLAVSVYATSHYRIMNHELLRDSKAYIGPVRRNNTINYHYLTPLYDGLPETHVKFKDEIMEYLDTGRGRYAT